MLRTACAAAAVGGLLFLPAAVAQTKATTTTKTQSKSTMTEKGSVSTDIGSALEQAGENGGDVLVIISPIEAVWGERGDRMNPQIGPFTEQTIDGLRSEFEIVALGDEVDMSDDFDVVTRRNIDEMRARYRAAPVPMALTLTPKGEVYGKAIFAGDEKEFIGRVKDLKRTNRGRNLDAVGKMRDNKFASDAERLDTAYLVADFAVGPVYDKALETIRTKDASDPRGAIARAELDRMTREQLDRSSPDWGTVRTRMDKMAESTPSVRRLGDYHALRAFTCARTGDADGARDAVRKAREEKGNEALIERVESEIQKL